MRSFPKAENKFLVRLQSGQKIICADGYKSELLRRGFLCDGYVASQAVLQFDTQVRQLHEEFVHCGSDVVVACNEMKNTWDEDGEAMLRKSMRIARSVADESSTLMAGRVDSTGYTYDDSTRERIEHVLTKQIKMAVEERADFVLCQMFRDAREARKAIDCIKHYGQGIPSVVTMSIGCQGKTTDDVSVPEALHALEVTGADVVGLACDRGPSTLMPLIREARKLCKGPLAAIPTAYRTKSGEETLQTLTDPFSGCPLFPKDLDQALCCRKDITKFATEAQSLGVQFVGLCDGAIPSFIREISDVYGKTTPSSKFSLDITKVSTYLPNLTPHRAKRRIYQLTQEYKKYSMK